MKFFYQIILFLTFNIYSTVTYSDTDSNANLFGSWPDIRDVVISPDGKYVGVVQTVESQGIVKILDLDKGSLVSIHDFGKKGSISRFFWATNERLVFSVTRPSTRTTENWGLGQLVAANIDGKNTRLIAGWGTDEDRKGVRNRAKTDPNRGAYVVHRLPNDKNHIIVNFFDNAGFNDLAKLNINNGKVTYITGSPVIYPSWVLNDKGDLMGVWSSDLENRAEIYLYKPNLPKGSLESRECIKASNCYIPAIKEDNKKPGWVFFKDFDFPKAASIEGFKPNGKMMVVEHMDQDTLGLYEYDLLSNSYELIYRHPDVDITGIKSSRDDGPYGIRIDDGKPEYLYLSEPNKVKDLDLKFFNAFPNSMTVLTSRSDDYTKAVGVVSADNNPGIYYLIDTQKNLITPLGRYWSKTSYDALAKSDVINFKNRHGDNIQSYFTKAVGRQNAPTIVYPHGGPWARDWWGFDPEVQFLAAEGFNVLQNNIRGSSGYGLKHMTEVYGNFDTVLEDMFDSIENLHNEGLLDKNNVCVYGASYGGYAATQGPMMRPDLFKCAISEAGLYDINAQYTSGDIRWGRGGKKFLEATFGDGKEADTQSPVNYVNRLKTPFMIIHGEKDIRTPYKEAQTFMKKLDKAGIKYEKMIIAKETHGFSREENRIEKMKRISAFFNKYLDS
jgi:dipeptidyl aminopeptidase/acylaminoacyl peptidase